MGYRLLDPAGGPAPKTHTVAGPASPLLAAKARPVAHEDDLLVLMLALTNGCNLACSHCYREDSRRFPDELGPIEVVRVLREFAELAHNEKRLGAVVFSGGEPLLARHLGIYVRAAYGLGLGARINTNATLATPAIAQGLAAWGVEHAQVSLDGPSPGEHEAVRGPGTWHATRRGVGNMLAAGVDVVLKVTLMPGRNDRDPAGYLRVARQWGVRTVSFARAVPLGSGSNLGNYAPAQYRHVLENLAAARVPGVIAEVRDATFDRSFLAGTPHRYFGEEGRIILAVDADGTCYVSRRLPLRLGNVRETPLAGLWTHPALEATRTGNLTGKCAGCDLREVCGGGSRAAAWAATGDPLAPDPACWVEAT